MYSNKKGFFVALLASSFVIFGCGSGDKTNDKGKSVREEVVERYEGGRKKVVVVYRGIGVDEEMVRRVTFTKSAEKKKIEDLENGETKYYGEIHDRLSKADSLEDFLTESVWYYKTNFENDNWSIVTIYGENESHTILSNGEFSRKVVNEVEYKDGMRVKTIMEDSVSTEIIKIIGPNEISYNKKGDTYRRIEASELEVEALKSAVKEL